MIQLASVMKIMNIKYIAKIEPGQDGAVWNNYLFRFDSKGKCFVYDLSDIEHSEGGKCEYISSFALDKSDIIAPHSNCVTFGNEYYDPDDEYPLLYTNIYNNYAKADNPMKGTCLVYRIRKNGNEFTSDMVQIIEIGFTEDENYWKSREDARPYGNFTIDREKGIYYAFTMRTGKNTTRYFSFDLPGLSQGFPDGKLNVNKVILGTEDIKGYFDCEYHRFLQGAVFNKGKIYSLEGFTDNEANPAAMRIIDADKKLQMEYISFAKLGFPIEPELIDFANDKCYYGDYEGNLYILEF